MTGNIRVGRCKYDKMGKRMDPIYKGYTSIIVLTKSSEYGSLGPYLLTDSYGRIIENVYQGSKVYEKVPKTIQRYSRWDNKVIWDHPAEIHIKNNILTSEYYNWRNKLMNNKYAVRYPLGYGNNKYCKYAYRDGYEGEKLDYIETRKLIYIPLYCDNVIYQKQYKELENRLKNGENLLIIEVDGPHQEDILYYKSKYNVNDDFIENDSMLVNEKNIDIMLNDTKHPFGHGYCLAMSLLNLYKK